LALAGLQLEDIGVIELNEAFAVQALAVMRAAKLDPDRVNPNGGAIALGHPARLHGRETYRRHIARDGTAWRNLWMVTMCVGGGQGAAGIFQRL